MTREIDEQTRLGEVYMRSLIRSPSCDSRSRVIGGVLAGPRQLPLLFWLGPG